MTVEGCFTDLESSNSYNRNGVVADRPRTPGFDMAYRPVFLKPGNYSYNQERPTQKPLPKPQWGSDRFGKENLYAVPRRVHSRNLFRGGSSSDLPTTSTQINGQAPVSFEKHLREREFFSTSSSLSDDELELSRKKKRERLSTHYSTSDLTTSDSSIGPSWITSTRRFASNTSFQLPNSSIPSLRLGDNRRHDFNLNPNVNNISIIRGDNRADEKTGNQQANGAGLCGELRRLESIEEMMSSVLPVPTDIHDDQDLPPKITPLRFATSMGLSSIRFPTTNPHHQETGTPHLASRRMVLDKPRSIFETKPTRSEEFGLPSQMAKHYGIKGILFMTITMTGIRSKTQLNVFVQHGTYFLQRYPELSTYITMEIKYNKRYKKRSKATTYLPVYKSDLVRHTNQPDFNYDVNLLLNKENFCSHDKLGISVYTTSSDNLADSSTRHELLGCMTFSLRRLREKAKQNLNAHRCRSEESRIKVCDGGYFLLGDKFGEYTNMPQDKIYHRKYYDEIGSATSHSGSHFDFPQKLAVNEPCNKDLQKLPRYCRSALLLHAGAMGLLLEMMGESSWRLPFNYKDPKIENRCQAFQLNDSQRLPLNVRPASSNQHYFVPNQQHYLDDSAPDLSSPKVEHRYNPLSCLLAGSPRKKPGLQMRSIFTDQYHPRRKEQHASSNSSSLMSKEGASSSNSSSTSSAVDYKSHYRFTLPSITTTATTDASFSVDEAELQQFTKEQLKHGDHRLLNATVGGSPPTTHSKNNAKSVKGRFKNPKALTLASSHRLLNNQPSVSATFNEKGAHHSTVRRVASFTYSTDEKNSKQTSKRFTFGPISKIGSLLRSKVDSVNSTSVLYPTKEEVRTWQQGFEYLLQDKYGRHLFRQFVTCEISSENLDFYEEVEQFKKMKPGKKVTLQRAHDIYNRYFVDGAPKELNLDSATKQSTLAAYKGECSPDTFNLAQSRIEQLMAKDSYARFIHSKIYLDLLDSDTPSIPAFHGNVSLFAPSASVVETGLRPSSKLEAADTPATTKSKSESPIQGRPTASAAAN